MSKVRIGVIVGSARREAFSGKIAQAALPMLRASFDADIVRIDDLPMFNQDYDDDGATPESWTRFRREIEGCQGFLFVTPEYNRSLPPLFKNALDVASRPYGQNKWDGKPGAIIGVSPGRLGAFGAYHHARQCFSFLNIFMMQQPEKYVADVADLFDEQGVMTDERAKQSLQSFIDAFAAWVARFV